MLFGLISNWLANHDYVALERQAEAMIDLYLDGLRHGRAAPPGGEADADPGERPAGARRWRATAG